MRTVEDCMAAAYWIVFVRRLLIGKGYTPIFLHHCHNRMQSVAPWRHISPVTKTLQLEYGQCFTLPVSPLLWLGMFQNFIQSHWKITGLHHNLVGWAVRLLYWGKTRGGLRRRRRLQDFWETHGRKHGDLMNVCRPWTRLFVCQLWWNLFLWKMKKKLQNKKKVQARLLCMKYQNSFEIPPFRRFHTTPGPCLRTSTLCCGFSLFSHNHNRLPQKARTCTSSIYKWNSAHGNFIIFGWIPNPSNCEMCCLMVRENFWSMIQRLVKKQQGSFVALDRVAFRGGCSPCNNNTKNSQRPQQLKLLWNKYVVDPA